MTDKTTWAGDANYLRMLADDLEKNAFAKACLSERRQNDLRLREIGERLLGEGAGG